MKKKNFTKPLVIITLTAAINLLISGKAAGQFLKNQIVNLQVSAGTIYVIPPTSIEFPKTILNSTADSATSVTTNFSPADTTKQITVVDEGTGNTFSLEASLSNFTSGNDTLPYQDIGILSMNQNPNFSVDLAGFNNPDSANHVDAPLNFSFQNDITSTPEIPDASFFFFTGSSSESGPVVLVERTAALPSSIGNYSVVPEFRANIPTGTTGETFSGELTLTLTSPIP